MTRHSLFSGALALSVLLGAGTAQAVTYDLDFDIGAANVSGFIETDNTLGALATANVTDYSLTLTSPNLGNGSGDAITRSNETQFFVSGSGFTATATDLSFDFLSNSIVIFLGGPFSNFFCLDGVGFNCSGSGDSTASIGFGASSTPSDSVTFAGNTVIGSVAPVPLPASLPLALAGISLLGWFGRRRKTAA